METNQQFINQEQSANILKKDLDNLTFRIKEKELLSNQIFSHFKQINDKLSKSDVLVQNLKKELDEIIKQKEELTKKIKNLENFTFNKKTKNMNQIEDYKKISKKNEELNYQLQIENEQIYKLSKIKESLIKNKQFNEEVNIKKTNIGIKKVEDEAIIAQLSLELHRLENQLFEKKNKQNISTNKEEYRKLQEKLIKKQNKKQQLIHDNREIKQNIEEMKKVIKNYKNNYKSLLEYAQKISLIEGNITKHLTSKKKSNLQVKEALTLLQN